MAPLEPRDSASTGKTLRGAQSIGGDRSGRRRFVWGALGAVALGAAPWMARAASAPADAPGPRDPLGQAAFTLLVGNPFAVSVPGRARPWTVLVLAAIEDVRETAETEQFSLLFAGPRKAPLPEGVYTLSHRTAGRIDLLLQPGAHARVALYYRAPFNLLR